jgi:hypothetical protein
LGGIVDLVCFIIPIALLGGFSLVYYYMASPKSAQTRRLGKKTGAEVIVHEFERQYKNGRISRTQFEDILLKYSSKDRG